MGALETIELWNKPGGRQSKQSFSCFYATQNRSYQQLHVILQNENNACKKILFYSNEAYYKHYGSFEKQTMKGSMVMKWSLS